MCGVEGDGFFYQSRYIQYLEITWELLTRLTASLNEAMVFSG